MFLTNKSNNYSDSNLNEYNIKIKKDEERKAFQRGKVKLNL